VATEIEWVRDQEGTKGLTWNPVTGCDRVSPGCDHCYAATLAKRLKAMGNPRYQTDGTRKTSGPGFGVALHYDKLDEPRRRSKGTTYFVNSMSDLFHSEVPDGFIAEVFATMALTPQHTYQVLTKRPRRMANLLPRLTFQETVSAAGEAIDPHFVYEWPLPNVWLGTSVENQEWAEKRIPLLLQAPAAVRFLSCEPLLDAVNLSHFLFPSRCHRCDYEADDRDDARSGVHTGSPRMDSVPPVTTCTICTAETSLVGASPLIHWVIVGGESGPGHRPMQLDWARDLRDQCRRARVPFFFKQWGGRTPKVGGRELEGETWNQMPFREETEGDVRPAASG
jgi:protein gp37